MEFLTKLEHKVIGWLKDVPHLPNGARKWLGTNVWWIVVIGVILGALAGLFSLIGLFTLFATLSSPVVAYYASSSLIGLAVAKAVIALVFLGAEIALLAFAINPLKAKQKKGWVLLFMSWLVGALSVVVTAVLTLNPFSFIMSIIFGALWVALGGYLLFEIHGQFAHVERSKGVQEKKK